MKAKPHPDQFGFAFDLPRCAAVPGALAGLEAQLCGAVGTILNSDPRSRAVIAAEMSDLLAETVSTDMLNAYASRARIDHRVSMSRFMALVEVTKRHDVLDQVLRPIGAAVLFSDEVHTALIGQLEVEIAHKQRRLRAIKASAPLIRGGKEA